MQSPLRSANADGPGAGFSLIVAAVLGLLILLSQAVFIVPAGNVAVVTTLGKVTGIPRGPGANFKAPLVQAIPCSMCAPRCGLSSSPPSPKTCR